MYCDLFVMKKKNVNSLANSFYKIKILNYYFNIDRLSPEIIDNLATYG